MPLITLNDQFKQQQEIPLVPIPQDNTTVYNGDIPVYYENDADFNTAKAQLIEVLDKLYTINQLDKLDELKINIRDNLNANAKNTDKVLILNNLKKNLESVLVNYEANFQQLTNEQLNDLTFNACFAGANSNAIMMFDRCIYGSGLSALMVPIKKEIIRQSAQEIREEIRRDRYELIRNHSLHPNLGLHHGNEVHDTNAIYNLASNDYHLALVEDEEYINYFWTKFVLRNDISDIEQMFTAQSDLQQELNNRLGRNITINLLIEQFTQFTEQPTPQWTQENNTQLGALAGDSSIASMFYPPLDSGVEVTADNRGMKELPDDALKLQSKVKAFLTYLLMINGYTNDNPVIKVNEDENAHLVETGDGIFIIAEYDDGIAERPVLSSLDEVVNDASCFSDQKKEIIQQILPFIDLLNNKSLNQLAKAASIIRNEELGEGPEILSIILDILLKSPNECDINAIKQLAIYTPINDIEKIKQLTTLLILDDHPDQSTSDAFRALAIKAHKIITNEDISEPSNSLDLLLNHLEIDQLDNQVLEALCIKSEFIHDSQKLATIAETVMTRGGKLSPEALFALLSKSADIQNDQAFEYFTNQVGSYRNTWHGQEFVFVGNNIETFKVILNNAYRLKNNEQNAMLTSFIFARLVELNKTTPVDSLLNTLYGVMRNSFDTINSHHNAGRHFKHYMKEILNLGLIHQGQTGEQIPDDILITLSQHVTDLSTAQCNQVANDLLRINPTRQQSIDYYQALNRVAKYGDRVNMARKLVSNVDCFNLIDRKNINLILSDEVAKMSLYGIMDRLNSNAFCQMVKQSLGEIKLHGQSFENLLLSSDKLVRESQLLKQVAEILMIERIPVRVASIRVLADQLVQLRSNSPENKQLLKNFMAGYGSQLTQDQSLAFFRKSIDYLKHNQKHDNIDPRVENKAIFLTALKSYATHLNLKGLVKLYQDIKQAKNSDRSAYHHLWELRGLPGHGNANSGYEALQVLQQAISNKHYQLTQLENTNIQASLLESVEGILVENNDTSKIARLRHSRLTHPVEPANKKENKEELPPNLFSAADEKDKKQIEELNQGY
ncbi:MAG: hypothetical protein EP298_10885 [Gammaproteobacteria bacterium]|nr:MAG: hypothetical protein EP298_10885 [Gammaproteobacteria bacterium]UTW41618.1 hypothetical protein KFE69_08875 [bacterium SCSIO 12844]